MELKDEQVIVSLLEKDPELRKYYEEHQELEKKLADLQHRHHLTTDDELEIKRIQKLKLAGKDHIMELLSKHRTS